MFRPNVAIIRFSSESMVVVLYRIGMDMSRWSPSFLDIVVLLTDPTPIIYIHTTGMAHFRIMGLENLTVVR